jgi:uncharacterized protein YecE (DUF72 family)
MKFWTGCSGFSYPEWRGMFYPEKLASRKWFEYYCERFNTVELNTTFYRFPQVAHLKGWYDRSPRDFRFAVKAPRIITHYRRFKNASDEMQRFYDAIHEGLSDKLGSVLFQLHPMMPYSEENLERILSTLHHDFINVLEFRHASWWRNDVLKQLKQHHVTFCSISFPGLPDDIYQTAPVAYYRFHGTPKLYYSDYNHSTLRKVLKTLSGLKRVSEVYIYFNNTAEGHAVNNALYFKSL